jgi:hypothetical protein
MLDDSVLDDPSRLIQADSAQLLRACASAGAQVRATVDAAHEAGLESWSGFRPRAVVLLDRPGVSPAASRLLSALLEGKSQAPIVVADSVPGWIGALDVVIAHGDDPNDVVLAESVALAGRRGARVLLTGPDSGPVAAAAARDTVLLPNRVPVPPGFSFPRALAGGLLAADALGLVRTDFGALADQLDAEAERGQPRNESFVNPAKALALRISERIPLLWGLDSIATALGKHGAFALAAFAGVVADVSSYEQSMNRPALRALALRSLSPANIFADPDDEIAIQARVFLLSVHRNERIDHLRQLALIDLPGAELVEAAPEIPAAALSDQLVAAVLALRLELASVYLGLAAGTVIGTRHFE